jgi:hypothetical protein
VPEGEYPSTFRVILCTEGEEAELDREEISRTLTLVNSHATAGEVYVAIRSTGRCFFVAVWAACFIVFGFLCGKFLSGASAHIKE